MTNKETKRKRLEEVAKRVFNVFCYVVTALAITLGIAVGVTKCSSSAATETAAADLTEESAPSNSKVIRKRAVDLESVHVYMPIYTDGSHDVDFAGLRSSYDVPVSLSPTSRAVISANDYFDNGYFFDGDEWNPIERFKFEWRDLSTEGSYLYEYCLYLVQARTGNQWVTLYNRTNLYASGGDEGVFSGDFKILVDDSPIESVGILAFFSETDATSFEFNQAFNYNAPFNLNVNAVYGSGSFDGGGDNLKYKDISVGWFYSNGRLFDSIRWWAVSASVGVSVVIEGTITTITSDSDYVYAFMYYRNSQTSEEVLVNSRDNLPYGSGISRYYANSTTWSVPAYRKIVFLTELSASMKDIVEAFNNNNQSTYGGGLVSGEVNDIFSLIAGAFTAWLPVLSLYILPNITIGTLLFVPLVALLVFAIIRIIKK